jgi:DNA-binding CsgD family transcriptional regulator
MDAVLVQREAELRTLSAELAAAREGEGRVVYLQAPAGAGRSRLLMAGAELARQAGMRVLEGRGRELETEFPFAVAAELFHEHRPVRDGEPFPITHALFELTRDLCTVDRARCPLAVIVDDLQWVDQPTLRFLAYLAARISDLPITLITGAREGEPATDQRALNALRDAAGSAILRPAKLGEAGVAAVVHSELPEAGPQFVQACKKVTDGNPFLLVELLAEVRRLGLSLDAATAEALGDVCPESVRNEVMNRLAPLPPDATSLARAVSVLGDAAPLRLVAAVAELDGVTASRAADALAHVHVLQPGAPLSFAQPLTGRAVRASIPELEHGNFHRRAASALRAEGARAQEVAAHLMASAPGGDPDAVVVLRTAAGEALAAGAARRATQMLSRALDEAVESEVRAEVLAELRDAELAAQPPSMASDTKDDLDELPSERIVLAELAIQTSLRGEDRARVVELVERAWGGGALLEAEPEHGGVSSMLATALLFVDELERSLEICGAVQSAVTKGGSPGAPAAAGLCRAWALYHQGRVTFALSEAQATLDAPPKLANIGIDSVNGVLAACQLQLGALKRSDAALSMLTRPGDVEEIDLPMLFDVRAQLRLAQNRPAEALEDALEAGRRSRSAVLTAHSGILAWRSTAAFAHLALGQTSSAERLAEEELELARAHDLTRVAIRALRVLGLATRGPQGLELLDEAVTLGEAYPTRLEYMQALVDLGAALRRANQRTAAREPLHLALELGGRGGVTALSRRAQEELVATGAHSRRAASTGVEALTPSERRVADLAAKGRTTRQIASALFVTPKTVEFHLRHIYRKLDVPSSRAELTRALRPGRGPGPV